MIETLLNGRLDVWWEFAILIIIGLPIWFPILQFVAYISLRVSTFVFYDVLQCWRLL